MYGEKDQNNKIPAQLGEFPIQKYTVLTKIP